MNFAISRWSVLEFFRGAKSSNIFSKSIFELRKPGSYSGALGVVFSSSCREF